jgi:hypothetical protein
MCHTLARPTSDAFWLVFFLVLFMDIDIPIAWLIHHARYYFAQNCTARRLGCSASPCEVVFRTPHVQKQLKYSTNKNNNNNCCDTVDTVTLRLRDTRAELKSLHAAEMCCRQNCTVRGLGRLNAQLCMISATVDCQMYRAYGDC